MFIVVVFAYENGKNILRKVILLAYKRTQTLTLSIHSRINCIDDDERRLHGRSIHQMIAFGCDE